MKFIPVFLALLVCLAPVAAQSATPSISSHPTGEHALAINANGQVFSWGVNLMGALGNGTTTSSAVPSPMSSSPNYPAPAKACAAGQDFSLLLAADNTVWAWGSSADGRLGFLSSGAPVLNPVQVPGLSGVVAIAAGMNFSLALLGNGTVKAWGSNYYGQIGAGSTFPGAFSTPTTVRQAIWSSWGTLTGIVAIAAGEGHALALHFNGEVYSWGKDNRGQLGDGQPSTTITPGNMARKIPNVSGVVAIAAGADHSILVLSSGSVLAFGCGTGGRLGTGSTALSNPTPAPVLGVSGVVTASGGYEHSLFLTAQGTVYGCGNNNWSQLGLSTTSGVHPSTLLTDAGVCRSVAAGLICSLVIGADGVTKVSGGSLVSNPYVPVFTTMNALSLGCQMSYELFLGNVGGGLQMTIPCNTAVNVLGYSTSALYYANIYSLDPVNGGPLAGQGNWFGLHVSQAELDAHVSMAAAGFDMVFGRLDPGGGAYAMYPIFGGALSGVTFWAVGILINPFGNLVAASAVASTTL